MKKILVAALVGSLCFLGYQNKDGISSRAKEAHHYVVTLDNVVRSYDNEVGTLEKQTKSLNENYSLLYLNQQDLDKRIGNLELKLGDLSNSLKDFDSKFSESEKKQKRLSAIETLLEDASNGKYDYSPIFLDKDKVFSMVNPVYKISSECIFEVTTYTYDKEGKATEAKSYKKVRSIGTGSIIKKAEKEQKMLILTAAHVSDKDNPPAAEKDASGRIIKSYIFHSQNLMLITKEEEGTYADSGIPMSVLSRSQSADVSLLEASISDKKQFDSFAVAPIIGNSEELDNGHFIYLVGYPRNITKTFTNGIVTSMGNPFQSWDDTNFYLNATSNPGNSGGPAYALRDGKPEIVGVLSWRITNSEGMHGAVKITYAKDLLKDVNIPDYYQVKSKTSIV